MQELNGKTALVTGAGQGVGQGIARALADAGAFVHVNDLDPARAGTTVDIIVAAGGSAKALPFDVTRREQVREAIGSIDRLDILVNNVGNAGSVLLGQVAFVDFSIDAARQIVEANLFGVINCTQAALPTMIERRSGRIITISSEAGRQGLNIGVSVYGAAKAAVANLMRHVSLEVARSNITCNTVSLGLMNNVPAEFTDAVIASIPMGRLGTPDDVGAMCRFLASEQASWITGQEMVLNGGSLVRG